MQSWVWGMSESLQAAVFWNGGSLATEYLPDSDSADNFYRIVAFICALLFIGTAAAAAAFKLTEFRLRREIRMTRGFFREMLKDYELFVWSVHPAEGTAYFSSYARKLTGLSEHGMMAKLPTQSGLREAGFGQIADLMEEALTGRFPEDYKELSLIDVTGRKRYLQIRFSHLRDGEYETAHCILTGIDITEQKKLEERLHLAQEGSGAVIWEYDMIAGKYTFSPRWNELMGFEEQEEPYSREEILKLIHPEDAGQAEEQRQSHLQGNVPMYNAEYRMRTSEGDYRWMQARGKILRNALGEPTRFSGSLIDITDRKTYELQLKASLEELAHRNLELAAMQEELKQQVNLLTDSQVQLQQNEDKLQKLAYFDPVSGLPNRVYMLEMLESYLAEQDQNAALLFIDTDNFKSINDTLGHRWGDLLIREAGVRLNAMMPVGAMLFRFGGDEFVMMVKGKTSPAGLQQLARQLIQAFRAPFTAGQMEVHLSISIGIALYPEQAANPEELIKNADLALNHAQHLGKSSCVLYNASMQMELQSRMKLEAQLISALDHNEFELYYQPKVDAVSGRIHGFEALLRWDNAELGRVSPDQFIQVAEDTRQIIPIGEWVLLTACHFLKRLHRSGYGGYKMSVNISVIQLKQEGFVTTLKGILEEAELSPEYLEIEITESLFMESAERSELIGRLDQIRKMGIGIALDDFGTGYSSLGYLRELPITTLKMDKKFVDPLERDEASRSLASAILLIGHSLGLQIVAEGVETKAQLEFLQQHSCDMIQGYLFSRPLPERGITEILKN